MPYEINGIELIETTTSNELALFLYILSSIMIALILGFLVALLVGLLTKDYVYPDMCSNILAIIGLIVALILFIHLFVFATQNGTITHYTVKISDEITMQDFLEFQSHYDIVETQGEYFIITER